MNDINEEDNSYRQHPDTISYEHQPKHYRDEIEFDNDDDDDFFNENVVNYNGHDFRFIQDWNCVNLVK